MKNLKIHDDPLPRDASYFSAPIGKIFFNSPNYDPLDGLLFESAQLIEGFKLELPYTRETVVKKVAKQETKKARSSRKRSMSIDEAEVSYAMEEGDYDQSSIYNTSIPNKMIFFSPAPKKQASLLLQSTPVSMLKEAHSKKLLKMEKATIIPIKEHKVAESTADDSDFDPLACHAENIMRMAVDSTMMGSSFSLSFSSTFANDSMSKKKYPDFFTDDPESSVIEGLKTKWGKKSLVTLRAAKIEINAADLQAAVEE